MEVIYIELRVILQRLWLTWFKFKGLARTAQ
jgi:hypothetical protein